MTLVTTYTVTIGVEDAGERLAYSQRRRCWIYRQHTEQHWLIELGAEGEDTLRIVQLGLLRHDPLTHLPFCREHVMQQQVMRVSPEEMPWVQERLERGQPEAVLAMCCVL